METNLKELKNELLAQKTAIEEKRGTVIVKNLNPSPSEITEGIKSIETLKIDLTDATATEKDVSEGKTFYAGESGLNIRTGTRKEGIVSEDITRLIFYNTSDTPSTDEIVYTIPSSLKEIKHYLFYSNPHKLVITLPLDIKKVNDYAFYKCKDLTFTNINELTSITAVGQHAFNSVKGIDYSRLWPTVKTLGSQCFIYTISEGDTINLPETLTEIGTYCFSALDRTNINSIDLTKIKVKNIYAYAFSNLCGNCDLFFSPTVVQLASFSFYRSCFHNITIPSTITTVGDSFMNSSVTDPVSSYYLKTITFESEVPPTIGRNFVSAHNFTNGCKIYVPDSAVDVYKSLSNLAFCVEHIKPLSEKP